MTETRTLIMAVPWVGSRAKSAIELHRQTGGQIVWDQQQDAFHTWRLVLEAAGSGAVIILEDDVELTAGWREKIEAVIAEHPDDVIQFFSMRGADVTVGSRYEPGRTFMMNQCYYLPEGAAADLLEWSSNWVAENPRFKTGYDVTMAKWMQERSMKYWLSVPSLVQHRKWRSEINPKRSTARQSGTFA